MARFILHHAPQTRSAASLWALAEAGADYELHGHDLKAGTHKQPGFLAINPLGKLPALIDRGPAGDWDDVVVTEVAAIAAYIADALPASGLAPAIGTRQRAAYQFWIAYGPGVMEPGMADMVFPRAKEAPASSLGWPPFVQSLEQVEAILAGRPFLLGDRFSAADLVVGGLLCFMNSFGMLQPAPEVARYIAALNARPHRIAAFEKGATPS